LGTDSIKEKHRDDVSTFTEALRGGIVKKVLWLVAAFAVSACAGENAQPLVATPGALPVSTPAHAKADGRLIYVTNYINSTLTFYSYKTGKAEGSVTSGLDAPQGVCSDSKGNVFVGNTDDIQVLEFPHGGTTPSQTIATTGFYPGDCAISSKKTLAVDAICSYPSCGAGAVLLYAHETGTPTMVNCPNIHQYDYDAYDSAGNLFVEGYSSPSSHFEFCEVPNGTNKAIAVTLDSPPPFPAPMQWDGKYLAITGTGGDVINRYSISGSAGTLAGTVSLTGAEEYFTMASKKAVIAETASGYGYWKYPSGGSPYKTQQLTSDAFGGMAVSPAPKL
jgi:hypothetical protein